MVFSTNQVRHLYVAKENVETTAWDNDAKVNSGAICPVVDEKTDTLYFKYQGEGGRLRSDLIKVDSIMWARHSPADTQLTPLKKAVVTLNKDYLENGNVISGQDYILRIVIRQFAGMSDEDTYIKYGVVHGVKGMDANTFYTKMVDSLEKNFSRELTKLLTFKVNDGIEITEVEQDWTLGVKQQVPVYFEVYPTTITYEGDEVCWADLGEKEKIVLEDSDEDPIPNSKKLADLEYFCMGERGDIYRNVGWPDVIPTKYMLDGYDKKGYDVLDIHYYFEGGGENPQKSEKDITIVGKKDVIEALVGKISSTVEVTKVEKKQ